MRRLVVLSVSLSVCLSASLLVGCSSPEEATGPAPPAKFSLGSGERSSAQASGSAAGAASVVTASSTPRASGPPSQSPQECSDAEDDTSGRMELLRVTVVRSGDRIRVNWSWTGRAGMNTLWAIDVISADGRGARQLGYEESQGMDPAHFVLDYATLKQTNVEGAVQRSTGRLEVTFPAWAVNDVGPRWRWQAAVKMSGQQVDACQPGAQ